MSIALKYNENQFLKDVLEGLSGQQKSIPSKYFYDERGSQLFDQICELAEYYPTNADLEATRSHVSKVGERLGGKLRLVELGSGSSVKTRILLDHLDVCEYVPVDISKDHMVASAKTLQQDYPDLVVSPCVGDYTRKLMLPEPGAAYDATLIYFPGSSVGNFHPDDAGEFLGRMVELLQRDAMLKQGHRAGALFIGVDLKKDRATLELAYDDPGGVTADFNKNVLIRINDELDANFVLDAFAHRAVYDEELGRIEMHLVSTCAQSVQIGPYAFDFAQDETILTEVSYKYSKQEFQDLSTQAGFNAGEFWTDSRGFFGLHLLSPGT